MLWMVPSIEQQGTLFRWLWAGVFLVLLEILGAPLFIYWQLRVAQSAIGP